MRTRSIALVLSILAATSASCTSPRTQLVPVVSSDLPAAQIACVVAEAGPIAPAGSFVATASPRVFFVGLPGDPAVTLPFSFGLVPPGDDASAHVELHVSALSRCTDPSDVTARTVTRVVRSGFVRGQKLALPIFLSSRCLGVMCADGLTCEDGTCVAVPDIDPTTLRSVAGNGDELRDGGGGGGGDGGVGTDTGAPTDGGTLPDAGASCPLMAAQVDREISGANIAGFGLTHSATTDVRFFGCPNCMRAHTTTGGSDLIGVFRTDIGAPIGGAVTQAGDRLVLVYPTVFGLVAPTVRTTGGALINGEPTVGSACATSRCAAALGSHVAILRGTNAVTLVDVDSATGVPAAGPTVTSASSGAAIRSGTASVLIAYANAGSCTVERWPTLAARDAMTTIPQCARPDVVELTDGRFAVGWSDPSDRSLHAAFLPANLAGGPTGAVTVDATQTGAQPIEVAALASGGFRVTWVDDNAGPFVRSVRFDAAGTPLGEECIQNAGHALTDYARLRTERRPTGTAIAWPFGSAVFEIVLAD